MPDIFITFSDSTQNDANEIVSTIYEFSDEIEIKVLASRGFLGFGEVTLLISALGGGVFVSQLAKIIIAWIKRHEGRSVKIGKTEITGYSVDEVERLLKATSIK